MTIPKTKCDQCGGLGTLAGEATSMPCGACGGTGELPAPCHHCGGTGSVDTGAQTPWGGWYESPCPYCEGNGDEQEPD